MIPGDDTDVEMIETTSMVAVDIWTEREERGVVLTFAFDDRADDVAILLTPEKARALGDQLFRVGS